MIFSSTNHRATKNRPPELKNRLASNPIGRLRKPLNIPSDPSPQRTRSHALAVSVVARAQKLFAGCIRTRQRSLASRSTVVKRLRHATDLPQRTRPRRRRASQIHYLNVWIESRSHYAACINTTAKATFTNKRGRRLPVHSETSARDIENRQPPSRSLLEEICSPNYPGTHADPVGTYHRRGFAILCVVPQAAFELSPNHASRAGRSAVGVVTFRRQRSLKEALLAAGLVDYTEYTSASLRWAGTTARRFE